MRFTLNRFLTALLAISCVMVTTVQAQGLPPVITLFKDVRIFDGTSSTLSAPSFVLVRDNKIEKISTAPISVSHSENTRIINGSGRTLLPGLIDAHTHIMFATLPQMVILTSDVGFINVAAVKAAEDMLIRRFTSIRDVGGPVFGLKRGIDMGLVRGPRIWPAGVFISQSGGHGDFRLPNKLPSQPGDVSFSERSGAWPLPTAPMRCGYGSGSNWLSVPLI